MKNLKIFFVLAIIAIIFVSGCAQKPTPPTPTASSKVELSNLKKFSSLAEAKSFIENNTVSRGYGSGILRESSVMKSTVAPNALTGAAPAADAGRETTPDYSKTNVQVQGVDEADIVKTDGKYIYTVSGNNKIVIVEAYPAENGKVLSSIEIDGNIDEMFVNKDKLVVFGRENVEFIPVPYYEEGDVRKASAGSSIVATYPDYPRYTTKEFVRVYDITDRASPVLKRNLELNGDYFDSRMIGNWVYFVVNKYVYGDDVVLPMDSKCVGVKGGCTEDIYYIDEPADSYMFTLVGALNLEDDSAEPQTRTFLLANTEGMFVSLDNIYITHQKFQTMKDQLDEAIEIVASIFPVNIVTKIKEIKNRKEAYETYYWDTMYEIGNVLTNYTLSLSSEEQNVLSKKLQEKATEFAKSQEKTVVYKISVSNGEIKFVAQGEFPGHVLNQFSMDEFNGYFRTATTTGDMWDKTSKNHVYVLGDDGSGKLNVVGKVEDLAPGESIYSARFLGERAYVVTFKKVDPLFVLDLKDPTSPRLLGKLKIPGYSDYLHPYDQNYVIGIGKNTIEASEELKGQRDLDFAWYQGVKLSLFDATDPENPKELAKFIIGDRGTESLALQDHKAFLFSKERNLLVIPVLLAEIKDKSQEPVDSFGPQYGDYTFQGAYVFELTLDKGFVLKGRITHVADPESFKKSGYYYFGSGDAIQRSLYIGDVLYTISDAFVKANSLTDLSEVKIVKLIEAANQRLAPTQTPEPSLPTPTITDIPSPTPEPNVNITPGIQNTTNSTAIHWHTNLTIKINGTFYEIPHNIGIVGGETNSVHTHDEHGIIHMEITEPTEENIKLGYFFSVWGKKFDDRCIFEYCNSENKTVKMLVNGQENTKFGNYTMADGDSISIEYG